MRLHAIFHVFLTLTVSYFGLGVASHASTNNSPESERKIYLVSLTNPPVVAYALQQPANALKSESESGHRETRLNLQSVENQRYLQALEQSRIKVMQESARLLNRNLIPHHVYRYGANGFAVELTAAEAEKLANSPGISGVRPDWRAQLLTDVGPQWIGASSLWNGSIEGVSNTRGEGVVVGIIDSGINPDHPAFAAKGSDGVTINNSRGKFYGLCANNGKCNSKLIGMYDFTNEGTAGIDSVGHGSHVAGIAAGNVESNVLTGNTLSLPRDVSGVAPRANIISYKACGFDEDQSGGGCDGSDLVAAIDQAIADGVDVINYSIGSTYQSNPFEELSLTFPSDTKSFFNARAAGIVVTASAGNEGPGPGTISSPANAPWIIAVASASHSRAFINSITDFSGGSTSLANISGQGFTAGYGPQKIVNANDYGFPLCAKGEDLDFPPTGTSNPWPEGTFNGEIVLCERGVVARVTKGFNLKEAGAGGMILINDQTNGDSVISDDHYLPAVHIGYTSGQQLKAWLASGGSHNGRIAGVSVALDPARGDILSSFSSRGGFSYSGGIIKPDVTAPGDSILSATQTGTGLAFRSGTSMASPHVAGAAALILGAHPDWSPAQVESALLTTADANVRKEDEKTPATPWDMGGGRVQVGQAAIAGLYFPLTAGGFTTHDPLKGGKVENINRPSIQHDACFQQCRFTRTVTDMSGGGTWSATSAVVSGASITITPSQFSLAPGASQTLDILVDVGAPSLLNTQVNGRIALHKMSGGKTAADTVFPLAVYSDPGAAPAFQDFGTLDVRGFKDLSLEGLANLPKATFQAIGLSMSTTKTFSLLPDSTLGDAFDLPSEGAEFVLLENQFSSERARLVIAEVNPGDAPGIEIYVGADTNEDGIPQPSETLCHQHGGSRAIIRCVADARTADKTWALVQLSQGSPRTSYNVDLTTSLLYSSQKTQLVVTGPGHVASQQPFSVRLSYEAMVLNQRYFGAVLIDGAPGLSGQAGVIPFAITRLEGNTDSVYAIQPNQELFIPFALAPGKALEHAFIDVPANANKLTIQIAADADIDLYAIPTDFPAASARAAITAAPPRTQAQGVVLHSSAQQGILTLELTPQIGLKAGRWYISAVNAGENHQYFSLNASMDYFDAPPKITLGSYYNPQRSGHGIFMNEGGDQRVIDWYTYLEDGTPTWYVAQNVKPADSQGTWTAPLARVVWDGKKSHLTQVGDVMITPISTNQLIFSWHLNGQSGSEIMNLLAEQNCPQVNGAFVDYSGGWYAPAESGYGVDVISLSNLEFIAFYLYDALGVPRWIAGSIEPFGGNQVAMNQFQGFCPLCEFATTKHLPVGALNHSYNNATSGQLATNIKLVPPLSGDWNINQSMARLTGSASCGK